MKNSIFLSNSDLLKLSRALIERDTSIRFQARGFSMRPYINDGDLITVSPLERARIRVGDVVLYKTPGDQAIVHRVIRKRKTGSGTLFSIKGDATFGQSEDVDRKMILGRVTAIERSGRERRVDTKLYRAVGLFFAALSPFSRWTYPIGSRIKRRGRRLLGSFLVKLQSTGLYALLAGSLIGKNIQYGIAVIDNDNSVSRFYSYNRWSDNEALTGAFKEQLKNSKQSGYLLAAKKKGTVIGSVYLNMAEERNEPHSGWWLFGMKVNWRYRRLGIGKTLTMMASEVAEKHGATEIKLLVFEDAAPANNLYRKLGFRRISIPHMDKLLRKEVEKDSRLRIILAKDLSPRKI